MCSGARSSSAKAAIACRASVACSWSTSRRMVLSLWTISGPSFTQVEPSLLHFLCCLDVDDPVDGKHPFGVLRGVEDADPSARHGYRNNRFQFRIPQAVHDVHHDLLPEPDGLVQGLQSQLGCLLAAGSGGPGAVGAGVVRKAAEDGELGGDVGVGKGGARCAVDGAAGA